MSYLGGEAEVVADFIIPGSLVLDIGAHHGTFTLFALERGARVAAIEPQPQNLKVLYESVKLWGDSCQVIPAAVGRETGRCSLVVQDGETSSSHCVKGNEINVIGWDDLRFEYPDTDLMKMDIEGGEYDLFPPCDLSWLPAFVIETHDWTLPDENEREGVGCRDIGSPRRPGAYEELLHHLALTHELQISGGSSGGFVVGRSR